MILAAHGKAYCGDGTTMDNNGVQACGVPERWFYMQPTSAYNRDLAEHGKGAETAGQLRGKQASVQGYKFKRFYKALQAGPI